MSSADPSRSPGTLAVSAKETGQPLHERAYNILLTGVAIMIPIVITLYVLRVGIDFVRNALEPFIESLRWAGVISRFEGVEFISLLIDLGTYSFVVDFFTKLIALLVLFVIVVVVGAVGRNQHGEEVIGVSDLVVSSTPSIGTVYKSFRRTGDVVLDEGADEFQDVKLIQCFDDDVYMLGFQTGGSPAIIEQSTGHKEMVLMFLLLASNPITSGLLTYIPADDVYDIDMTIEEGIRSILTSGVVTDEDEDALGVNISELRGTERLQDIHESMITTDEKQDDDWSQHNRTGASRVSEVDFGRSAAAAPELARQDIGEVGRSTNDRANDHHADCGRITPDGDRVEHEVESDESRADDGTADGRRNG